MSLSFGKLGELIGLVARGFLMGIAEVLPGISGGTVALLTGVYDRLIGSLADLAVWLKNVAAKQRIDLASFIQPWKVLLPLAIGMVVGFGVAVVAVVHLLDTQPLLVWSAIFGIVIGAVLYAAMSSTVRNLIIFAPIGLAFALALSFVPGTELEARNGVVFVGAILAYGAWILPGISGSFVLLILGVWTTMVKAFASFQMVTILVFLTGLLVGWLVFSHPVRLVLQKYRPMLMGVFCGLLAGSLWELWPWNHSDGQSSSLPAALTAILLGFSVVSVLTYAKVRKDS